VVAVAAVAITAAGGGHTGRAVALAERLAPRLDLVFVVAEGDAWSRSRLELYGEVVEVPKLRSPRPLAKGVARLPRILVEGFRKLPREICAFVSMGAGLSVPLGLAARLRGVRVYNVESAVRFAKPSLTAWALQPLSHVTVLQWEEQLSILPRGRVYGPIYEFPKHQVRDEGYVLVTGGSYGFKKLFDAVSSLGFDRVVLQTGRVDPRPYREKHRDWIVFRFTPDFGRWIAGARLVITHFGQTAVDSVLTYRKPTVMVYNPEWRTAAGLRDARILARKLNVVLVEEVSLRVLEAAVEEAFSREIPSYPDGARALADEIVELCGA
jgi:UDP-N-acetylglucosamine--N-acetylmuramyl-(pentapeptide) pyrophosphoryl-undecaprenol N-acetylglucosamine transferase